MYPPLFIFICISSAFKFIFIWKIITGTQLTDPQKAFNTAISGVRIAVEWGFGNLLNQFQFLDLKQPEQLLKSPIGKYYLSGVFLFNCYTCFNGGEKSTYFDLAPPSLDEYLG